LVPEDHRFGTGQHIPRSDFISAAGGHGCQYLAVKVAASTEASYTNGELREPEYLEK
jgi:hypothetical protein